MPVILRIAFRNLREHRSKTLIIGIIIAAGIMVMTIGTSLIDTATKGIEQAFIENYTADILIGGYSEDDLSIFGVQSVGGIEPTPQIPDYARVIEHLAENDHIEMYTPQVTGFASISLEGQEDPDARGVTFLFGIEPESYRQVFDRIEIVEGEFLAPGESGILLTNSNREIIEKRLNTRLEVGDKLLLTGFSSVGIKIREVQIRGFYRLLFESEGVNMSSYIDIPTLRALKALNLGGTNEIILDPDSTALLEAESFDELFSGDAFENAFAEIDSTEDPFAQAEGNGGVDPFLDPFATATVTTEPADGELEGSEAAEQSVTASADLRNDSGGYEFILLSMKNRRWTNRTVAELNRWFADEGIQAQAMNWKGAAGPFSSTADVIRNVFNIAVLLVAFVAMLIITNTLLISVMERKKEIGTMRAIGASRRFVSLLFTAEILTISLVFGVIGELLGLAALGIVSLIQIQANNTLVEILFAGPVLRPVVHLSTLGINILVVVVIGILANVYPVAVALKIQPVKAISSV